jgi:hypothetical protein
VEQASILQLVVDRVDFQFVASAINEPSSQVNLSRWLSRIGICHPMVRVVSGTQSYQ